MSHSETKESEVKSRVPRSMLGDLSVVKVQTTGARLHIAINFSHESTASEVTRPSDIIQHKTPQSHDTLPSEIGRRLGCWTFSGHICLRAVGKLDPFPKDIRGEIRA